MSTLAEIEAAVVELSVPEKKKLHDRLAAQLEAAQRDERTPEQRQADLQEWLKTAVGVGKSGMTTDEIMAMTRGEE